MELATERAGRASRRDDGSPDREWRSTLVRHARTDRSCWWTAFVTLGVLGGILALALPPGSQPDEPAHLVKAAAVARGHLGWSGRSTDIGAAPGQITMTHLLIEAPFAFVDLSPATACAVAPPPQPWSCTRPASTDTTPVVNDVYIGAYPPLPYLLMGWPSLVLEPDAATHAARLSVVVICAALYASAFVAIRRATRSPFGTWGVALAITPAAVFFSAAANPMGLEIAASVCVGASLLELLSPRAPDDRVSGSAVARTALAAGLLVNTRPASLAVFALVALVMVVGAGTRARLAALARDRYCQLGAIAVGVATLAGAGWFLYARPLDSVLGIRQPDETRIEVARHSLGLLPVRARELVGVFGWGDTNVPSWMAYGWLVLIGVLVVAALVVGTGRQRVVLTGLVVVNVAIPTVAELPKAHDLGYIWQGRYSLPFFVAVPIYAGWCAARRRADRRWVPPVAVVGAGFVGLSMVVSIGMALTRIAQGTIHPRAFGFVGESLYAHGRLLAAVLVVGGLLYAAFVALVAIDADRRGTPTDERPTATPAPA